MDSPFFFDQCWIVATELLRFLFFFGWAFLVRVEVSELLKVTISQDEFIQDKEEGRAWGPYRLRINTFYGMCEMRSYFLMLEGVTVPPCFWRLLDLRSGIEARFLWSQRCQPTREMDPWGRQSLHLNAPKPSFLHMSLLLKARVQPIVRPSFTNLFGQCKVGVHSRTWSLYYSSAQVPWNPFLEECTLGTWLPTGIGYLVGTSTELLANSQNHQILVPWMSHLTPLVQLRCSMTTVLADIHIWDPHMRNTQFKPVHPQNHEESWTAYNSIGRDVSACVLCLAIFLWVYRMDHSSTMLVALFLDMTKLGGVVGLAQWSQTTLETARCLKPQSQVLERLTWPLNNLGFVCSDSLWLLTI